MCPWLTETCRSWDELVEVQALGQQQDPQTRAPLPWVLSRTLPLPDWVHWASFFSILVLLMLNWRVSGMDICHFPTQYLHTILLVTLCPFPLGKIPFPTPKWSERR